VCPAAAPSAAQQDFVCRGRDPGWELRGRGGGQATFLPEKGAPRNLAGASADLAAEGVVVWRGRPTPGDAGADLVAVMLKGACTDPGAGEVSSHSAVLSLPNASAMVGCCSYGPGAAAVVAAAPPPSSSSTLALLAPLAASPPRPAAAPPPEAGPPAGKAAAKAAVAAAAPSAAKVEPPAGRGRPGTQPARAEPPERGGGLKAGARTKVAGPARERVLLRLEPNGRGRVAGSVRGGQAVVVGEAAPRGGQTWYRITGKGVPDRAWIRGDLLVSGGG
jgi:hypothetical protein